MRTASARVLGEVREEGRGDRTAEFERARPRLLGVAYRMLGSMAEAEEVVQDAYLRWHEARGGPPRDARAWLVTATARLSIDRLRRARLERRAHPGPWLPEPIATPPSTSSGARAERYADLSLAFLVLLERLTPEERAALVLHDALGLRHLEVARALGKSEAASRQLLHRARRRVREGQPRGPALPRRQLRLLERFVAALEAGDPAGLLAVLAPEASWTSDGGGRVAAARNVVRGAERVVRLLLGVRWKQGGRVRRELVWANGEPVLATWLGSRLFSATAAASDGQRLLAFYAVLDPEKLRRLEAAATAP